MTIPDAINGGFEVAGSLAIWQNVRALLKDKEVKGFRLGPTVFFALWSAWNSWFYPHLHQLLSFVGGLAMALALAVYTVLTIKYLRK